MNHKNKNKNKNKTRYHETNLTKHTDGGVGFRVKRKSCKDFSQNYPNCQKTDIFFSHIIEIFFFSKSILKKKKFSGCRSIELYIQSCLSQKVVWSCGLGVKFLMVCHRCRSKLSLWVAYLNIQTRLAGGSDGRGLNFVRALSLWWEIIHNLLTGETEPPQRSLVSDINNQFRLLRELPQKKFPLL